MKALMRIVIADEQAVRWFLRLRNLLFTSDFNTHPLRWVNYLARIDLI
jgi:hypothetical protein